MTTISAESILASRNIADLDKTRFLHTVRARYPLWIHQELLTHRAFSRNTASSRAIPIKKMIWEAEEDPAMPIYWTANEPGMQGYTLLEGVDKQEAIDEWLFARDDAVKHAYRLAAIGCHKQVANRLLGPYIHTTAVISATEWMNFLLVRLHSSTEPHMRDLAFAINEAHNDAVVKKIEPGVWHLPFVSDYDKHDAYQIYDNPEYGGGMEDLLIPLSVARCASISFKTVEQLDMTADKAHALYQKLVVRYPGNTDPIHASPAEHAAQADDMTRYPRRDESREFEFVWNHEKDHRNFVGFRQWRSQIPRDTLT